MTSSKLGGEREANAPSYECCMCGDYGLSYELFRCKVCQFRSQHRYCSNMYPKAETYRVCNWCLCRKNDDFVAEKTPNSSNSSSSSKNNGGGSGGGGEDDHSKLSERNSPQDDQRGLKAKIRPGRLQLQQLNSPVKKLERSSPPLATSPAISSVSRKRIINGAEIERLRRTKSDDIANRNGSGGNGITKQVFRNKVRRYKLLDEVSSQ